MKITFAGAGSAFTTPEYYQSNIVVESGLTQKRFLVDCGSDARFALAEMGLKATDVDGVYISHLHADHIGGLEWLAFVTHFAPGAPKPKLYVVRNLADALWRSLEGGLHSIEGDVMGLGDYFDMHLVPINQRFYWGELAFSPVQTVHIMNGYEIVPSYGPLIQPNIKNPGHKVFITTDTQYAPHQIERFYREAEIIFQDCETTPAKSGVHAHYDDLKGLPAGTRAKMWLYHYQPDPPYDAVADGFRGFVRKGQEFCL